MGQWKHHNVYLQVQESTSGTEDEGDVEEEAGADYSDDYSEEGADYEEEDDDNEEKNSNKAKKGHHDIHNDLKHVSCLKNIPNDSYCEGWKKATCDKKNRQIKITKEGRIDKENKFSFREDCCGIPKWSRDWKTLCGDKVKVYRPLHHFFPIEVLAIFIRISISDRKLRTLRD